MTHVSLLRAWENGRAAIGGWISGGGEFSLDIFRRARFDYVAIDCQHSSTTEADAANMLLHTAKEHPATFVRVSNNDPSLIGQVVDAGADGIIIPMVESPDDAAAAVAAVRYAPNGIRSYGPIRADLRALGLSELADRVSVLVMIETLEGVESVEAITKVPGLAGVYVGPGDLSISLGLDRLSEEGFEQVLPGPVERIRRACEAAGIVLGMHQTSAAMTKTWISRGVRMASVGADRALLTSAVEAAVADVLASQTDDRM